MRSQSATARRGGKLLAAWDRRSGSWGGGKEPSSSIVVLPPRLKSIRQNIWGDLRVKLGILYKLREAHYNRRPSKALCQIKPVLTFQEV